LAIDEWLAAVRSGAQFTCCTGTKVHKSTNTDAAAAAAAAAAGATLERAVSLSNMFNPQVFLNALRQQVCAYELLMNFNVYVGYDIREGVDI
jgi:hypothetical protein